MARAVQIAPAPHQLEPIELPDDGALVIETSGVEVLDGRSSTSANDNATSSHDAAEPAPDVVPFAWTLRNLS